MVKVISRSLVEINPGEIVKEVVLSERILFFDVKITIREVHGRLFKYKKGRYTALNLSDKYSRYFNLPIDEYEH